ncbi:MAG: hypothetical protein JNJ51_06100 [Methylobacillus glycogenes]|nr:hypothetical protein [Methylobacillus glycogenes]
MVRVTAHVDAEDILDELDIDDIAEYLVKQSGYREAIARANGTEKPLSHAELISDLVANFKHGRPVEENIRLIAYEIEGKIV